LPPNPWSHTLENKIQPVYALRNIPTKFGVWSCSPVEKIGSQKWDKEINKNYKEEK
jgi:hypothetical protein